MYSSGFYETPSASLEDASTAKLKRICSKLNLSPQDHILEIGSGWGGFAICCQKLPLQSHDYDHLRRTVSICQEKIRDNNLEDKIQIIKKDYRELDGSYDKLVSIEMIEAVGAKYLDTYLNKCSSLLKDHGPC